MTHTTSGPPVIKPGVAFGLPYQLIELFYIGMPVVRTVARSVYGHVITKFSRIGRLLHFLSYEASRRAWSSAMNMSRNAWASVSVIYYPSIKYKYNRLFFQKSLMTLFHIFESKFISLYPCQRAKDDRQFVVDIDKRMYVLTLLMVLYDLWLGTP